MYPWEKVSHRPRKSSEHFYSVSWPLHIQSQVTIKCQLTLIAQITGVSVQIVVCYETASVRSKRCINSCDTGEYCIQCHVCIWCLDIAQLVRSYHWFRTLQRSLRKTKGKNSCSCLCALPTHMYSQICDLWRVYLCFAIVWMPWIVSRLQFIVHLPCFSIKEAGNAHISGDFEDVWRFLFSKQSHS